MHSCLYCLQCIALLILCFSIEDAFAFCHYVPTLFRSERLSCCFTDLTNSVSISSSFEVKLIYF